MANKNLNFEISVDTKKAIESFTNNFRTFNL